MGRSKTPIRRIQADPQYKSVEVARLIHYVMKAGNKSLAMRIVYGAFDIIKEKTGSDPLLIFEKAKEQVLPKVEVKPRRIGGANIQVPVPVRVERQLQLFLRWMVSAAVARREKTMIERLGNEFMDAAKGEGTAVKRKASMDKSAQSHKVYAHLR